MPRHSRSGHRISAFPDVTPIVNVALVLLILFMISIPTVREGISVKTPEAKHSKELPGEAESDVAVSLTEDGSLYVNLKKVSWNELEKEVTVAYRGKETRPILIKGAKDLLYRDILRIMEACRNAGAQEVELMAKKVK